MITIQEHADRIVSMEYRQPLQTIEEACASLGWKFQNKPECCGKPVRLDSIIDVYMAECSDCGRFARDMAGPLMSGGAVQFVDTDRVEVSGRTWISGVAP